MRRSLSLDRAGEPCNESAWMIPCGQAIHMFNSKGANQCGIARVLQWCKQRRLRSYRSEMSGRDAKNTQRMEDQMTISNQTVERCIEECLQCSRWCAQCRAESLDQDPIMMKDCIRLCNECLELCRTCVALLTGSSGFAHRVCSICSELCTACAAECGKYEGETMRKCAQACRQCAITCAEVAQAGPIRRAAA